MDKTVLIEGEHTVGPDDLNLIKLLIPTDEVVDVLDNFYKYNLKPNFLEKAVLQNSFFITLKKLFFCLKCILCSNQQN
jgi:hypothetical protein